MEQNGLAEITFTSTHGFGDGTITGKNLLPLREQIHSVRVPSQLLEAIFCQMEGRFFHSNQLHPTHSIPGLQ